MSIEITSLVNAAKQQRIQLVAEEWIEAGGRTFPGTNEGSEAADAYLVEKYGITDHYEVLSMKRWKQRGRPMPEIIAELNEKLRALGLAPQEYDFTFCYTDWRTPEEERDMNCRLGARRHTYDLERLRQRDHERELPLDYCWIACYPVGGTSEGYYVHIDFAYREPTERRPDVRVIRELVSRIEATEERPGDQELIERAKLRAYDYVWRRKMLAIAKTWDWDNACAVSAVAATLLGA